MSFLGKLGDERVEVHIAGQPLRLHVGQHGALDQMAWREDPVEIGGDERLGVAARSERRTAREDFGVRDDAEIRRSGRNREGRECSPRTRRRGAGAQ
ncbi:MAG: hypothetical protein K2X47_03135, partial [Bdellovibrionales bacterium]|nr:hypothetical protein [Bdellovibrionales bacterium]